MKKNRIVMLLAILSVINIVTTAQTSQKLSVGKASDYGLIYTLPLTALDIYIEAELTEEHPGDFYNYARKHLSIDNAIVADRQSAKILSVVVVPKGVPNKEEQWLAQFKNGTSAYMTLSPDNIPLTINCEASPVLNQPALPVAKEALSSPLETPEAQQAVTQDMARSSSTSKKAELAANRIFELREMRSDILSGQADNPPADGAAMKLVLDNIAAQEAALTAMFAGVRTTRTIVEKVSFVPEAKEVKGKVIARLSVVDGIVDADNLAGAPITVDMRVIEEGELPLNEKGEKKTFPKGGVAYCIPGIAEISVSYAGNRIASEKVSLAQLGVVFGLNPALFTDKKEPYSLVFDPATGAVVKLEPTPSK
ncbi:MAG: DUF4831 family protein [Muribaculaceae bacterium]|nr:DUF4831 family protein [Muribaculaceae bacterium]